MSNIVCLFEDEQCVNLNPLVYLRPVFELRSGILTIKEKYQNMHPELRFILQMRKYLAADYTERNPTYLVNQIPEEETRICFINSRVIPENKLFDFLLETADDTLFYDKNNNLIAANVNSKNIPELFFENDYLDFTPISKTRAEKISADLFNYPWDLVNINGSEIEKDFKLLTDEEPEKILGKVFDGVYLTNPDNIYIAPTALIKPGVVLDAENGPIYIDDGAVIFPNAALEGPCYIGKNSKIKIGAKIYENTSIGPVCKVGGEVEESIIHSYSNKQHDGFLGHTYLAQWVNLGADTNNSDLKNNYGNVKAVINDELIDTESTFVGLIMGDHSKTGINTMFNTGTVAGVGCNIYGSGFPPKYIPSFSWGGSDSLSTYKLDKFLQAAEIVMARRNVTLSENGKELLSNIFRATGKERIKRDMQE